MNIEVQAVEYPFFKVPYETAVKSFKKQRKIIEKEISSVLNCIIQLRSETTQERGETERKIDSLIARLLELKTKLNTDFKDSDHFYQNCLKRVEIFTNQSSTGAAVSAAAACSTPTPQASDYHLLRAKRLVIDELMRNGDILNAKNISSSYGISDLFECEFEIREQQARIIADLKQKRIESAMEWCRENESKLSRVPNDFLFCLIEQRFIQLLETETASAARKYLQHHASKFPQYITRIQKLCMCILVQRNLNDHPTYATYFHEKRWDDLIKQFNEVLFITYGLPSKSPFATTLNAGIASLKTLNCTDPKHIRSNQCPVCNPAIRDLAISVPFTHKVTSQLICRITGEVMNHLNPPYVSPQNQIFSEKGIERMKIEGQTRCPITKLEVDWSSCKKIFLS